MCLLVYPVLSIQDTPIGITYPKYIHIMVTIPIGQYVSVGSDRLKHIRNIYAYSRCMSDPLAKYWDTSQLRHLLY